MKIDKVLVQKLIAENDVLILWSDEIVDFVYNYTEQVFFLSKLDISDPNEEHMRVGRTYRTNQLDEALEEFEKLTQ